MLASMLALLMSTVIVTPGAAVSEPWAKGCAVSRFRIETSERARRGHLRHTIANYEIIRPWTAEYDVDPILSRLRNEGYTVHYSAELNAMGRLWYLYAIDNSVAPDETASRSRLLRLCDIVEMFDFTVLRGKVLTVSERRKQERDIQRDRPRFARLPEMADLNRFLSRNWNRYDPEFFSGKHTLFSRVHDNECRYEEANDYFDCKAGVLATSQDGPEYQQRSVLVEWGPWIFGVRELKEHHEEIILIN